MIKLVLAAACFLAAFVASVKMTRHMIVENRATEWPEMEKSAEPLSAPLQHWTLVHIRDDIGSIPSILMITNGLLAAILAVLLASAFGL